MSSLPDISERGLAIVASEAAVGAAKKADRLVMRSAGIAVTLVLCIWSPAVLAQREFDRVSQSIRHLIDEQDLPSVVVAVAKNGRIVWEEGFGPTSSGRCPPHRTHRTRWRRFPNPSPRRPS
jgi:CubicO group peptidase (beta-lactamase class C family)